MTQRLITQLALFFIYAASAFCLWGIGTALIDPLAGAAAVSVRPAHGHFAAEPVPFLAGDPAG